MKNHINKEISDKVLTQIFSEHGYPKYPISFSIFDERDWIPDNRLNEISVESRDFYNVWFKHIYELHKLGNSGGNCFPCYTFLKKYYISPFKYNPPFSSYNPSQGVLDAETMKQIKKFKEKTEHFENIYQNMMNHLDKKNQE